jgi:glycosyltransferase involved in cell wall biosynthesis
MISVIFCSIDKAKADATVHQYSNMLGDEPHEIILIQDARSLAEAYNRGLKQAKGDIIVLSHDDIEFLQPSTWLSKVKSHLSSFDFIGLAGTTKLIGPAWALAGPPYNFGQVAEMNADGDPYRVLIFGTPSPVVPNIQAVDGLFMAFKRDVVNKVRFDEVNFNGFHCYDIDFSFSAYKSGFRLGVATDIPVLHASQGSFDGIWGMYAQRLCEKHYTDLEARRNRPYQNACVTALNKEELLEIMLARP